MPFKADSILGLYDQICNAPLTFPPDAFVSDSLKHLLTRLLDKDPESRISLPSVMAHHWVTHNGAYPLDNIQARTLPHDELLARSSRPARHPLGPGGGSLQPAAKRVRLAATLAKTAGSFKPKPPSLAGLAGTRTLGGDLGMFGGKI